MSSSRKKKRGNRFSAGSLVPSLSPQRWAYVAVVVIVTALLAYHAATFSVTMIARRHNPDLALRINPDEPVALATKADELLLTKQDPKTLARVEEMARRSLRAQALNPTAVRILGYVADARGQHDQARKLILLSEKMSRREFGAQLWLIEDAAARRDYKEALRHYDIALRTTDEASGILFPTLTDALAIPEIRRDFAPYVREWPNWMSGYLSNAIGTSDNPANIADVMLKAGKIRYDKNNIAIADALLAQLAVKGKYAAFRQYYTTLPGARAQSLTTAAFNRDTVNLQHAPAGWQISDNPAIGGSFVQKGDSGIYQLQAFAGSGERGVVIQKLLFLKTGRYRFAAGYAAEDAIPDAELRWDLQCVTDKATPSLWTENARLLKGNSQSSRDFVIGTDCPVQRLVFQLAGGSGQLGADVTLRSVSIQRMAN